jgi:acyl-CoA thioesterase FadM
MVAFDFEKQQPVTVPEEWVTAMEAFEKRKLR